MMTLSPNQPLQLPPKAFARHGGQAEQALAAVKSTFDFMKQFSMFAHARHRPPVVAQLGLVRAQNYETQPHIASDSFSVG